MAARAPLMPSPALTPIPLHLDPAWSLGEAGRTDQNPANESSEEPPAGAEFEHYDLFADALLSGAAGGEEGTDPDDPRPEPEQTASLGIARSLRNKATPLLTLEEAQARLPDGVKEHLVERLKGHFREVRRYQPRPS